MKSHDGSVRLRLSATAVRCHGRLRRRRAAGRNTTTTTSTTHVNPATTERPGIFEVPPEQATGPRINGSPPVASTACPVGPRERSEDREITTGVLGGSCDFRSSLRVTARSAATPTARLSN